MRREEFSVVDENVLVVANKRSTHADTECLLAVVDFLVACARSRTLCLDSGYEILNRYERHCHHSGEPGVGDQFFRWAHENVYRLKRGDLAKADAENYAAFPRDEALSKFDIDDRIYVALALLLDAQLVNAVDSDYAEHAQALRSNRVRVRELCPHEVEADNRVHRRD